METTTPYQVPTALTVLAGIFLALGAICLIIPIVDMVWRKGWRSMMWIMCVPTRFNRTKELHADLPAATGFQYGQSTLPTSVRYHSSCTSATVDQRIPAKEDRVAMILANPTRAPRKRVVPSLHQLIPKRPPRRRLRANMRRTTITPWVAAV